MPFSDFLAALRWWAALVVLGAVVTSLLFHLLRRLPDHGYAFVKMAGLLLVSFFFWLLGSLGMLGNNLGGILIALVLVLGLSAWAYRQSGRELRGWLNENRRYVLLVEGLFLGIFLLWCFVRAQNPAIEATEKPMEFAFLNAAGRSPVFPPLDPWLSGYAISYYYFGYVMTSVLARLAVVPEAMAFNLGIAWLTAGTAIGAFGMVYNLITARKPYAGLSRRAVVLGLVAALALPLAGNLEIVLEMAHGNGLGPAGFWQWLDVRDLNSAPDPNTPPRYEGAYWWWWRSSRVIHEYHLSGRAEEGLEPIAEFPAFSFLLGDMHPHVLALPFAFLSLAVALAWWLRPEDEPAHSAQLHTWSRLSLDNKARLLLADVGLPLLLFTAVVLGGLSFLNTWDVLIHLFIVVVAFVLAQWRSTGRWANAFLGQGVLLGVVLVVLAVLFYLPFYLSFRSQAGPPFLLPMLMRPTRLAHFLIIFGMPLSVLLVLLGVLVVRLRRQGARLPWRTALYTALALVGVLFVLLLFLGWFIAASDAGHQSVLNLTAELGLTLPPRPDTFGGRVGWGLQAVGAVLPAVLSARLTAPWLTLLLAGTAGVVVMLWAVLLRRQGDEEEDEEVPVLVENRPLLPAERALPFVLLLILTGALLTLGPEFVYLRDNFGQRLNTIFKFYYQAWVLFGVAALVGLDYLLRRARLAGQVATAVYGVLLVLALFFPIYGVPSRAAEYNGPPTLDGVAHLSRNNPDEYAALQWLRQNAKPGEVVVEAVGGQYSSFGRVSANTGLPTLLGWAGHEYQWRGSTPEPALREPAVQQIYTAPDWPTTANLLNQYGVDYIYLGPLEVGTYGAQVYDKFAGRLEVAYVNNSVIIYRWLAQ